MQLIEKLFKPENIEVLYHFVQPLLYKVINLDESVTLVYVLQDRVIITKDKKRALVEEILVVDSTEEIISSLLNGEISIREALTTGKSVRISMIGNKIYGSTEVSSISEIENRIPLDSVYINK